MWGTFVLDAYGWEQRRAMQEALEEIASPRDTYGFASGGIYCFWDVNTREVLYIGKAVDLPDRFATHNGLSGNRRGSKYDKVQAHFATADTLGLSIMVRSASSQTNVARLRHQLETDFGPMDDEVWESRVDRPAEAEEEIADAEGIGLRSHRLGNDRLPPWNRIEGRVNAWGAAMTRADSTSDLMTGTVDSLLQSRRTITELAADPTAAQYEAVVLQLARSHAVARSILDNAQCSDYQIIQALDGLNDPYSSADRERIRTDGYLVERCRLTAEPPPVVAELRRAWTDGEPLPEWTPAPTLRDA
jgi:hypothetical protein